jgi:hypothetical protein
MAVDDQDAAARAWKLTARFNELGAEYSAALLAHDRQWIAKVREQIVALHRQSVLEAKPPTSKD